MFAQILTKNNSYIGTEYPSEHYTFESEKDALAFMKEIIALFPKDCDHFMTQSKCHNSSFPNERKDKNYYSFRSYYLGAKDVQDNVNGNAVAEYNENSSLIGITNKVYTRNTTSQFRNTTIPIEKDKWFLYSKEYRVALPNNVYGAVYELRKLIVAGKKIETASIIKKIEEGGKFSVDEDRVYILDRAMKRILDYIKEKGNKNAAKYQYYQEEIEKEKKRRIADGIEHIKDIKDYGKAKEKGGRRRRKSKKARKSKGRKSRKNGRSRRRRR